MIDPFAELALVRTSANHLKLGLADGNQYQSTTISNLLMFDKLLITAQKCKREGGEGRVVRHLRMLRQFRVIKNAEHPSKLQPNISKPVDACSKPTADASIADGG